MRDENRFGAHGRIGSSVSGVYLGAADILSRARSPRDAPDLALEVLQLLRNFLPLVRVGRMRLHARDGWPFFRQLDVERDEAALVRGYVFLGIDGVHRALG